MERRWDYWDCTYRLSQICHQSRYNVYVQIIVKGGIYKMLTFIYRDNMKMKLKDASDYGMLFHLLLENMKKLLINIRRTLNAKR